jgi:translation initiation factor IF-2
LQTGANTTRLIDNTNNELQNLKNKTKGTSSDQQYLSNITRSAYNIISNQRLKVMNNGARNIALALYLTESESKQWIEHSRYMKTVATEVPKRFDVAVKSVNSDSWAALAWALQPPSGLFDQATSNYLLQLTEEKNAK